MKNTEIQIIVAGPTASEKSTIAALIHKYLETIGFENKIELIDNEEIPCSTTLRRRIRAISEKQPNITVVEKTNL